MSPSNEISPDANQLSIHDLARGLGIDRTMVRRNVRAGMPRSSFEAAREWRALHVRPRVKSERGRAPRQEDDAEAASSEPVRSRRSDSSATPKVVDFFGADELSGEELEDSIPRLRRLEKARALALERALKADNITAAVALRREYRARGVA